MPEQELDQWCWAAVAVSLAEYLKPYSAPSQCKLAGMVLNIPGGCCPDLAPCDQPAALTAALDAVNCHAGNPILGPVTFDQIKQTIDTGWPIPVRIVWEDNSANAHFVVISGYSVSNQRIPLLQVDDPFYGRSIVDYDTFVSCYQGNGSWERTYRVT
jgi:hypothetical protein